MKQKQQPAPVERSVEQMGVQNRDILLKVMDTLQCSKREALMYLSSMRQLEKMHPEYGIQNLPPNMLLEAIRQMRNKLMDQQSLNSTLKGPVQDQNNLDNMLKAPK